LIALMGLEAAAYVWRLETEADGDGDGNEDENGNGDGGGGEMVGRGKMRCAPCGLARTHSRSSRKARLPTR
jgi:hypothetical protein